MHECPSGCAISLQGSRDRRPHQRAESLDRAYDSKITTEILAERSLIGVISKKGTPAPLKAGMRWIVERTNSWHNAYKKLLWCTERESRVIGF
jgi:hypothetical protein